MSLTTPESVETALVFKLYSTSVNEWDEAGHTAWPQVDDRFSAAQQQVEVT